MDVERRMRIRALNDVLRRHHVGGRIVLTRGITALGTENTRRALQLIRQVTEFQDGDDPYGEHDFGSVILNEEQIFWKIDYYDTTLTEAAEDPADPFKCLRVMTIMLASEY